MYTESKKLHLIEELLKVDDDILSDEVKSISNTSKTVLPHSNSFQPFSVTLSPEKVEQFERNINEGCEKVYKII